MRRGSATLVCLGVAACYAPPAHGTFPALAEPAPAERPAPAAAAPPDDWTFDERAAIAYARTHSPALRDQADQEAVASARIGAARQLSNAELHLGETFDDFTLGAESRFVVALRLHPDEPWVIDARVAGAKADLRAEQAQTITAERKLASQVEQLYAQLAFGAATREIYARELEVLAERRRILDAQLAHATATRLESLLAAEDEAEVRATASQLDVALAAARAQLGRLLGIPPGQAWRPTWDLAALRSVRTGLDAKALVARALAASPDLARAAAQADSAGAAAYQERARRVPWIDSLQVERSVRDQVEWAVAATITLPLFSWNSGRIAAADAQEHHYLESRARLAADLARQVTDAAAAVEATGTRAHDLAAGLDPATQEIDALFTAERAAAASDPVKLLLLEERYVRAQQQVLAAAYDHRAALIQLEALIGSPP